MPSTSSLHIRITASPLQLVTWAYNATFPFVANTYTYGNSNQFHMLTSTGNGINSPTTYTWDANGNMQTQQYLANNVQIRHCWDEENRLQGVRNAQMAGYYQYDAQGERTYKSSYEVQSMMVNGHTMLSAIKPLETLYASPYMVGTRYGYTKHYFAGAERIASKTGTGGLADINQPVCTAQQLTMKREQNNILEDIVLHGCLQFANVGSNEEQLKVLHDLATAQGPEQECYWYHPDHIGSTAWVSGVTGTGIEHRCYLPFGEPFVTQQLPGAWNPRYTFSGKERDEETGYSYFGARYYQPNLSIWLSVDPMSDKYPSTSPYAYCANNPVKLVDPDGREIFDDIVIHGKNNSSLTVKTDIIDMSFDVDYDFGGNKTIDASNAAIGYQVGVTASADAVVGTSYSGYIQSALFLGGDYAGYWYDYAEGNAQIDVTTSLNLSVGVQKSWFLAIHKNSEPITPEGFAGQYIGSSLSVFGKLLIGGSANVSYSISKDKAWETYSLGISVSFGGQAGIGGGAGINVGGTKLIGNAKPTSDRTFFDKIRNWGNHIF